MRITRRIMLELDAMRSQGGLIFEEEDKITIYFPILFNKLLKKMRYEYNIIPMLNFTITSYYPFRPPVVKYLNKEIHSIYRISLDKEYDELIKNSDSCLICKKINCRGCYCMCCSTLVCKNNWGPLVKLLDVIDEFKNYINIKCRLIERIHCKKVQNRFLPQIPVEYLPIHNYL